MANNNFLRILVMIQVFGFSVLGCVSTDATYHEFGTVSDENFALIQVSNVLDGGNVWLFRNFVQINGQGDSSIWKSYRHSFNGAPQSIVRVPPGEYTFTITFIRSMDAHSGWVANKELPVNISFNVKAGKGYRFQFSTTCSAPGAFVPTFAEIVVFELDAEKISKVIYLKSDITEVARKAERFDM